MPRYKVTQIVPTECSIEVDAPDENELKRRLDSGELDELTWMCETDFKNILATMMGTAHP